MLLTENDVADFPTPEPDLSIHYGPSEFQFGELWLPKSQGPHPTIVLLHGGCWLAQFDLKHLRGLSAILREQGYAVWTLEYRRVGNPGGCWPGTFTDALNGLQHLGALARTYPLDLDRVIVAGHSAGGQLALFLSNVPEEMRQPDMIQPVGVVALAPAADLAHLHDIGIVNNVVDKLMGGSPNEYPERYQAVSPIERLPNPTPKKIIVGHFDKTWTPVAERYIQAAEKIGDNIDVIRAMEAGHFELIHPESSCVPLLLDAVASLLPPSNFKHSAAHQ